MKALIPASFGRRFSCPDSRCSARSTLGRHMCCALRCLSACRTTTLLLLLASMERDFSPEESWRLALETDPATHVKQIVWNGVQGGQPVQFQQEPGATLWRRLGTLFYSILPGIEELL